MAFKTGDIAKRLITSYPNCIVVFDEDNNIIDFEETVYNFAERIIENFDDKRQTYYFGQPFLSLEDCVTYLKNNVQNLYEACQEFVEIQSLVNKDYEE